MGDVFERLVQLLLRLDPVFVQVEQVEQVWLYSQIDEQLKQQLNLPPKDRGVDLLAKTRNGEYWTIQAKYRSDTSGALALRELGTFGTQSSAVATGIARGLICTTKEEKTPDFAQAKGFAFTHVLLDRWESLDSEFWDRVRDQASSKAPRSIKAREPEPYQQQALTAARRHFVAGNARRGKLIMPCGTGKSLIGYWTAVDVLKARTVVVAVPSLILVRQTLRDWAREEHARGRRLDALVVCSDRSIARENGEGEGDLRIDDLDIDATTTVEKIREWLSTPVSDEATRVVFVTYQSGAVLSKATSNSFTFDVGILDEAHKTAGWEGKAFQHLLDEKNVRIRRRIFMTATERTYDGAHDQIVGMNDASVYGTTYHEMPFGEAIKQGILADYTVLTITVTRSDAEDVRQLISERRYVQAKRPTGEDDDVELSLVDMSADDLATVLALRKAIVDYGLAHAVSFHARNSLAQAFEQVHDALNRHQMFGELETYRVSSQLSAGKRHRRLKAFAEAPRALMANARCLIEGVDVPAIDLVLFAQPRQSKVDIVQAIGRALRKLRGQQDKRAYILVPVFIEDDEADFEHVVEGTGFENLVSVLKAMSTTDGNVLEKIEVRSARSLARGHARSASDGAAEVAPVLVDIKAFEEKLRLRAWDRLEGLRSPRLVEEQILEWVDVHYQRTGEWPMKTSGIVINAPGETWLAIHEALRHGNRGLPGGSSLPQFLAEKRGVRNSAELPNLTEPQILDWADAHQRRTGEWPTARSGPIPDAPGERWSAINTALFSGVRGLPGGSSLPRLLAEKRGVRHIRELATLTEEQIVELADAHKGRTGEWPKKHSGEVLDSPGETWSGIDAALSKGARGLPGGSSLPQLLAVRRGVRNHRQLAELTEQQILEWVDAYERRTGELPTRTSGVVLDAPGESWSAIDAALSAGLRGLPGGSSLSHLLSSTRSVRNVHSLPKLTESEILEWADVHRQETGKWPNKNSGSLPNGETWMGIDAALKRGSRGLSGGSTLAQLLAERRGVRNVRELAELTEQQILKWIDAHKERTGEWPSKTSGAVVDAPGETWSGIDAAMRVGRRGLDGGSSLARLLAEKRGVRNVRELAGLTERQILEWADDHKTRTGEWPKSTSGAVLAAPGETWSAINTALCSGVRGLAGGSSLAQLLLTQRGVRQAVGRPPRAA